MEPQRRLETATRLASNIGSGFGLGLIFLGVLSLFQGNVIGGIWWFVIGLFLRNAARMSYRQLELRNALEGEPIGRFMQTDPITVPPSISVEDLVQDYIYKYHFANVSGNKRVETSWLHRLQTSERNSPK